MRGMVWDMAVLFDLVDPFSGFTVACGACGVRVAADLMESQTWASIFQPFLSPHSRTAL